MDLTHRYLHGCGGRTTLPPFPYLLHQCALIHCCRAATI